MHALLHVLVAIFMWNLAQDVFSGNVLPSRKVSASRRHNGEKDIAYVDPLMMMPVLRRPFALTFRLAILRVARIVRKAETSNLTLNAANKGTTRLEMM